MNLTAAIKISKRPVVTRRMIDRNDLQSYRDAIIYQLRVKSYFDANNDGIGDFGGLTQKLDSIKDLGATAVWVMPFYPSPLRDDGYDISYYLGINPAYGGLRDFKRFVQEAHERGLRVITQLVINHTSDQHPWFSRRIGVAAFRRPPLYKPLSTMTYDEFEFNDRFGALGFLSVNFPQRYHTSAACNSISTPTTTASAISPV